MDQLGELRDLLNRGQKDGTTILTVAWDTRERLQSMVDWVAEQDGRRPDFTFLSDSEHLVANRYGLWNPNLPEDIGPEGPGLAHVRDEYRAPGEGYTNPATFVIDCNGVVQWRHISSYDQRTRPTNRMIRKVLARIPKACSTNFAPP